MSDDPSETIWRAFWRELLTALAHEIGEHLPHIVLRWARRRFSFDPLDDTTDTPAPETPE